MYLQISGWAGHRLLSPYMGLDRQGPDGAVLHEVVGSDSPLLDIACRLFTQIFPEDRRYVPYVRACAQGEHPSHPRTIDHVWLVRRNGAWIGIRVFSYIKTRDFGHGAYIGFVDRERGKGLGSWLVAQTLRQLTLDAQRFGRPGVSGYLVEVERSIDAISAEERARAEDRLRFHRQAGGLILPVPYTEPVMIEGVDYLSPEDLLGEQPRPMHLVLIRSELGKSLRNLDLIDFVHGIYCDVYRLPPEHEFVCRSISFLNGDLR